VPPTFPIRRRRPPRDRHPFVYLAAISLLFSFVAFAGRFGMFYVAAGALAAVLLATGAILIALRAR
jgi:hypothetical protein